MQRLRAIGLSASLLLFACKSFSLPLAPSISAPGSPGPSQPPTSPLGATDALTQIPLHVGHGVRGAWYEVYFTDPSDSASSQLTGGLDEPLVNGIDAARLSVHVAIYSLSLHDVRDALIRAHRRGVDVKVVMESDNMDGPEPQALKDAGIPLLGDRRQGSMHNKFIVIDGEEVWTGSMNFTVSGVYADDNNLVHVRSTQIAEDYEAEFTEMFVNDQFGPDAGSPTPNPPVMIDGTPIQVYFSPDDHVQSALVQLLGAAQSSIFFLAFSFTSHALGDAIIQREAAGVTVSGVMDTDQARSNLGTQFDAFRYAGLDVRLDGNAGQMHDKVMIVDQKVVALGSYNFTNSAELENDENLLVIHSPTIAAQYLQEFRRIYALTRP
jgi:phosphatidylserine/phosphatidylglycerophosphate/cardiolipin synthase-like enzyme